jgi:hypothetical protein
VLSARQKDDQKFEPRSVLPIVARFKKKKGEKRGKMKKQSRLQALGPAFPQLVFIIPQGYFIRIWIL